MDILNSPDRCIYRVTKPNPNQIRVQLCVGEYTQVVTQSELGWEDVTDGEIKAYVYETLLRDGATYTGRYDMW